MNYVADLGTGTKMTHDRRNAAIMQMMKRHSKTVTVSKDAARKFLVESGFYTKDGDLTAKYGGNPKKPASEKR